MLIDHMNIQTDIDEIVKAVACSYPDLSVHVICHNKGQLRDAIALCEDTINAHPSVHPARAILNRQIKGDASSFMGLAVHQQKEWFGFKIIDHQLGMINFNVDQFEKKQEAIAHFYHLLWHMIDLYKIRRNPSYRNRFRKGPIIPKRSDMNLCKANLQGDVFSIALDSVINNKNNLKSFSEKRALETLIPLSHNKPENFPFIMVSDSCEIVINDLLLLQKGKEMSQEAQAQFIEKARQMASNISVTFDKNNIQQWWDFCIPAQDMAWRGYSPEDILSAAIHTSPSPFVRSIGYLVQELTDIEPQLSANIQTNYNAFVDPEVNIQTHKELIDTIFEEAVFIGGEENGSRALYRAANRQNEELTRGRFIGWCANALQDAAKAFENALEKGTSPIQAARMYFEGARDHQQWDALKQLSDDIIDQRRQGYAVTMGHIAEICNDNDDFSSVLGSIKMTMNDPSYIQKLEAANDLNIIPNMPAPKGPELSGPSIKGPAPNTPTPQAPTFAPPMPGGMPGMGGAGSYNQSEKSRELMRQRMLAAQKNNNTASDEHPTE